MIRAFPAYKSPSDPLNPALLDDPNDPTPREPLNINNTKFANAYKDAQLAPGLAPHSVRLHTRKKRRKNRRQEYIDVLSGKKPKTSTGLTKEDLDSHVTKHGTTRIVHRNRSAIGKKNPWILATTEARKILASKGDIGGSRVLVKKGSPLWVLATKLHPKYKRMAHKSQKKTA